MKKLYNPILFCLFLFCSCFVTFTYADEQNVNPNINQRYINPDFDIWQSRFERSGREVYDKRQEIVEKSRIKPGIVVADIGAGTGLFTRLFSKKVGSSGNVFAVDVSREFIDNILLTCKEQGLKNVVGIVNTQKDVLLAPDSIDVAFMSDTYHHFEFPKTTLESIRRALRPKGELIVIDYRKENGINSKWLIDHVRMDKEGVIKEIESAGFKLEEDIDFLKVNYFLRFSLLSG